MTHHNVKERRICRRPRLRLGLGDLEHPVASLGADTFLGRIWLLRHADRGAVVVVPHTDALHRLSVVDVVLVVLPAARFGLAHRALRLGAGARVSLWIHDGVMAALVAHGARGWALEAWVLDEARVLKVPLDVGRHPELIIVVVSPADGLVGALDGATGVLSARTHGAPFDRVG